MESPQLTCRLAKEGSQDKNGLGAVRQVVIGGRVLEEEITAFDPPRYFEYVVRQLLGRNGKPARFRHDRGWLAFSPSGDATRVEWRSRFEIPMPMVGWLLERLLARRLADGFRQLLEEAKATLERPSTTT